MSILIEYLCTGYDSIAMRVRHLSSAMLFRGNTCGTGDTQLSIIVIPQTNVLVEKHSRW